MRLSSADGNAGMPVNELCRKGGFSDAMFYKWRAKDAGMDASDAKRLKELETENGRLRRAVSDLTLDKLILAEAAKGNF